MEPLKGGVPLQTNLLEHRGEEPRANPPPAPQAAFDEALGEVRNYMHQYASCADPTESAARKERLRIAEASGQLEKTTATMVRAAHAGTPDLPLCNSPPSPSERIPAKLRLEPPTSSPLDSTGRVSAKLRLGAPIPPEASHPLRIFPQLQSASQDDHQGRERLLRALSKELLRAQSSLPALLLTGAKSRRNRPLAVED